MIFLIIVIFVLIVAVKKSKYTLKGMIENEELVELTLFMIIIVVVMTFLCSCIWPTRISEKPSNVMVIEAMRDNISVSGRFFIGCGNVEGGLYYFYRVKQANGAFRDAKIPVAGSEVYEENRKNGKVEEYALEYRCKGVANLFCIPGMPGLSDRIYKIFVPEGSVKTGFYELDLQ